MKLEISELDTPKKQTICLNMIVKDEANIIAKTLQNILDNISITYWVVSDTGSTDNTKDIIKTFFNDKNIPGEIFDDKWQDFGHNRTLALEHAYNKTDYLLIFDADDSFHGEFILPKKLDKDTYHLKFGDCGGVFVYNRPLLINNRKKFSFNGVLHEFLVSPPNATSSIIKGNYSISSGKNGARSNDPDKYKKDAAILSAAFEKEKDESLKDRYAFYCAQSYKDSNNKEKSIEWYKKTLTRNNWVQEKYYASLTIGHLYKALGDTEKALHYWIKSSQYDMHRIEGIVLACQEYLKQGMYYMVMILYENFKNYKKTIGNMSSKLFLDKSKYNYGLEVHASVAAAYSHKPQLGYTICRDIILNCNDKNLILLAINNMVFYLKYFVPTFSYKLFIIITDLFHSTKKISDNQSKVWEFIFDKIRPILTVKMGLPCRAGHLQPRQLSLKNKDNPKIIITFTTCKRYDLFTQTVNSLINHWLDYKDIDYWFCVDDNSSDEDRTKMRNTYPWIDYYMKSPEEKGHRKSMNLIWEKLKKLKPTYWIHMEDDFLFHKKYNYIGKGIEGLKKFKDKNVRQVLFNRNYGEVIKDYNIGGHLPLDDDFCLHDHHKIQTNIPNCNYWPHYSFRPSIIDVSTILELGDYETPNQFFEMDYAQRWVEAGYKSAFFNMITNRHIGKLTSERNDRNKLNAYELNNESQFRVKSPYIKIINLQRRDDRKQNTIKILKVANILDYEFIEAVDGKTLQPTLALKKLFNGNDFGNRRGVIGCALSHYKLWKQLLEDKDNDFYLIMEDDFTLCKDFNQKLKTIKSEFSEKELIFLGYHMFEKERNKVKDIYNGEKSIIIQTLNKNLFIGGTHCYSINKKGAKFLLEFIDKNGIQHGIDYVMGKLCNKICYETCPHITFAEWNEGGRDIDTDIQNDYNSLDFSKIKDNFIFIPQKDQIGHDLYYNRKSLIDMKDMAENTENCIAFNTLGFFKHKIDNLTESKYFGASDGIYIKKEYYDKHVISKKS